MHAGCKLTIRQTSAVTIESVYLKYTYTKSVWINWIEARGLKLGRHINMLSNCLTLLGYRNISLHL